MSFRSLRPLAFALLALLALPGCGGGDGTPPSDAAVMDAPAMDATALAPLGDVCSTAAGCESGFCVDGVCCESACDGVCESAICNSSGECTVADAATVCRAAADACDVAETCTGTTNTCPDDLLAGEGTECRAAAGVCDLPESCTGSSAACPSDAVVGSGAEVTCRPSAGACDFTETCDGGGVDCPADELADAQTTCGTYQCTGSAAACPTSCSTHADCASGAMCVSSACVFGRWAFTTSVGNNGNIGGLAGADAFCQGLADAAGLPGTYRVWLSDSAGSPSTRFTRSTVPWIMPSDNGGIILANDWNDLTDGTIDARFVWTEAGVEVSNNIPFTNTTGAGEHWNGNDCSDWTSTSGTGAYGNTGGTDVTWTQSGTGGACTVVHRYYCFQM